MATFDQLVNFNLVPGDQSFPDAARLLNGDIVTVFQSSIGDGDGYGVFLQRYDPHGNTKGSNTRVNFTTTDDQFDASVTGLADGGFVVAWTSDQQDGSGRGVFMQRYDAGGLKVGAETRVNTITTNDQTATSVSAMADGGFVVAWLYADVSTSTFNIKLQKYSVLSRPVGGEVLVNSASPGNAQDPKVAGLANGGHAVVWFDQIDLKVKLRIFDSDGTEILAETDADAPSTTGDNLFTPVIAALPSGDFVVAWQNGSFTAPGIYYRQFAADGTARFDARAVSEISTTLARYPEISVTDTGGYVIGWYDATGGHTGNWYRSFNQNGQPVQDETLGLSATFQSLLTPAGSIVALADGGVMQVGIRDTGNDRDVVMAMSGRGTDLQDFELLTTATDYNARAGNDFVVGSDANDTLRGGDGIDTLKGGVGDDLILLGAEYQLGVTEHAEGGDGNDVLIDWAGDSSMLGGAGDDILRGGAHDDTLKGDAGFDILSGGIGDDSLEGGFGGDRLVGGEGADTVMGGQGNDTLLGEDGDDILWGQDSADLINGGAGNDELHGGGWADTLNGSTGDDVMTGGWGADRFVFSEADFGDDIITDYQDGIDRIVVWDSVATVFAQVTITNLGANAFFEMGSGSVLVMGGGGVLDASDFIF